MSNEGLRNISNDVVWVGEYSRGGWGMDMVSRTEHSFVENGYVNDNNRTRSSLDLASIGDGGVHMSFSLSFRGRLAYANAMRKYKIQYITN